MERTITITLLPFGNSAGRHTQDFRCKFFDLIQGNIINRKHRLWPTAERRSKKVRHKQAKRWIKRVGLEGFDYSY